LKADNLSLIFDELDSRSLYNIIKAYGLDIKKIKDIDEVATDFAIDIYDSVFEKSDDEKGAAFEEGLSYVPDDLNVTSHVPDKLIYRVISKYTEIQPGVTTEHKDVVFEHIANHLAKSPENVHLAVYLANKIKYEGRRNMALKNIAKQLSDSNKDVECVVELTNNVSDIKIKDKMLEIFAKQFAENPEKVDFAVEIAKNIYCEFTRRSCLKMFRKQILAPLCLGSMFNEELSALIAKNNYDVTVINNELFLTNYKSDDISKVRGSFEKMFNICGTNYCFFCNDPSGDRIKVEKMSEVSFNRAIQNRR
jgi:hypothetical protein